MMSPQQLSMMQVHNYTLSEPDKMAKEMPHTDETVHEQRLLLNTYCYSMISFGRAGQHVGMLCVRSADN